jgi:hypothetical protein
VKKHQDAPRRRAGPLNSTNPADIFASRFGHAQPNLLTAEDLPLNTVCLLPLYRTRLELDVRGIKTQSLTGGSGRLWAASRFACGALCVMLQNRVYRGEIGDASVNAGASIL